MKSPAIVSQVCNDTGIGNTGISLSTPIPIRDIADMPIRNYYAFATAEELLRSDYLEVTEHTKHYLHMSMFVLCWCYACIITHYDQYDALFLRNRGKTLVGPKRLRDSKTPHKFLACCLSNE